MFLCIDHVIDDIIDDIIFINKNRLAGGDLDAMHLNLRRLPAPLPATNKANNILYELDILSLLPLKIINIIYRLRCEESKSSTTGCTCNHNIHSYIYINNLSKKYQYVFDYILNYIEIQCAMDSRSEKSLIYGLLIDLNINDKLKKQFINNIDNRINLHNTRIMIFDDKMVQFYYKRLNKVLQDIKNNL